MVIEYFNECNDDIDLKLDVFIDKLILTQEPLGHPFEQILHDNRRDLYDKDDYK